MIQVSQKSLFAAELVHTEPNFQPLKNTQLIQDHIPFSSDIKLEPKKSGLIPKQYWKPQSVPVLNTSSNEMSVMSDTVKYLAKREIVTSGLQRFDDCPQNYWGWKSSFTTITRGLALTAREELDLLVKWLGPKSSELAKRMSSVYVHDPAIGLAMLWKWIEESYGAPEAIKGALFKRIDEFPKISNRDKLKLQELADLLMELEIAKEEGYLPGLGYLDTARGIQPIVEKLPYRLQDKWITLGSQYKEDHCVAFPPFTYFSKFGCNQARTRNDPSFASLLCSSSPSEERFEKQSGRTQVSVRKTGVGSESTINYASFSGRKQEDPEKHCPLHKKPHPLSKCRSFRSKPLNERIAYLKEKSDT